jgi:hypothetical protein
MPIQWQSNFWSSKSHVVLPIMAMTMMHLSLWKKKFTILGKKS